MLKQKRSAQENNDSSMSKRHRGEVVAAPAAPAQPVSNEMLDQPVPEKELLLFFKNDPIICATILANNLNTQIVKKQEALPPGKKHPSPPLPFLVEWITAYLLTKKVRRIVETEMDLSHLGPDMSNFLNDKILAARESRKNRILADASYEPLVEQFLDVIFSYSRRPITRRVGDTAVYCELSHMQNYLQCTPN